VERAADGTVERRAALGGGIDEDRRLLPRLPHGAAGGERHDRGGGDPIWITCTSIPESPFITASLAEQVPGPVRTNTRGRPSVGRGWPGVAENPYAWDTNGNGVMGWPSNGSRVVYLSLKTSSSNVLPAEAPPATMYPSSLATPSVAGATLGGWNRAALERPSAPAAAPAPR
jgi:hypothetical protein